MDGVAVLNDERAFCDAATPIGLRGRLVPVWHPVRRLPVHHNFT